MFIIIRVQQKKLMSAFHLLLPNLVLDTHALCCFLPSDIVYDTGFVGNKLKTVSYPSKVHMNLT